MTTMTSQSLLATSDLSNAAQLMRAIHVRPDGGCSCGHEHAIHSAVANMLGLPPELAALLERDMKPQPAAHGGLTIAYQIDTEVNLVNVGFSKCRDDEVYSRTFGFKTSTNRIADKDKVYSFSLSTGSIVEHVLAEAKAHNDMQSLNRNFIATIKFEHLSVKAVEHAVGQAVKIRLNEIKLRAAEELAEVKNEQEKRRLARRQDKAEAKMQAAAALAQTLVNTNQVPPMQ